VDNSRVGVTKTTIMSRPLILRIGEEAEQ